MKFSVFLSVILLAAGCGGKSDMTGEIVPIESICSYEKWKPVAVEGYLAPNTMQCERASNKRKAGIVGCTFRVYANSNQIGASVPVYILASSWLSGKNNRIEDPESYSGNLQVYDDNGNPLPKQGLKIYDNDGNLLPENVKIRVFSQLPKSERCLLSLAQRIESVKGDEKWLNTERTYRNFPKESL